MNADNQKSIQAYNQAAPAFCEIYNRLSTEAVLPGIRKVIPSDTKNRTAVDLGCGSGRDAVWLAETGFTSVIGVDAAPEMITQARQHHAHKRVVYCQDTLPDLDRLKSKERFFNFYLLSAVWMHLNGDDRLKLVLTMSAMAADNAVAYISLRHGPAPADRPMFETSLDEVESLAALVNAKFRAFPGTSDVQQRDGVSWDYAAVQFWPTARRSVHLDRL